MKKEFQTKHENAHQANNNAFIAANQQTLPTHSEQVLVNEVCIKSKQSQECRQRRATDGQADQS
jgi:hypothetical protein